MMGVPLLVSLLLDDYFNVFGAFVGFIMFKLTLVITALVKKGGTQ